MRGLQPLSFLPLYQVPPLATMLFLWSKEPAPGPRADPWLAWFATALLLWRYRRRITRAILAASPLRFLKRRTALAGVNSKAASTSTLLKQHQRPKLVNPILQRKHRNARLRTRVKRLCTGDGPHVCNSTSALASTQQIHYKVTRSGKVYGKYPSKIATMSGGSEGNQ